MPESSSYSVQIHPSILKYTWVIVTACVIAFALPMNSRSDLDFVEAAGADETMALVDTRHESWPAAIFEHSYALIASEGELVILDTLTRESLTKFLSIFWKMRDPTPTTRENEFRTQFEERIEFALAHSFK